MTMLNHLAWLIALIAGTMVARATENRCEQTAVINISLSDAKSLGLRGLNADMQTYNKLFGPGKGRVTNFERLNLSRFPDGKAGLIKALQKATEGFANVQINIAGHGIHPVNQKRLDEIEEAASKRREAARVGSAPGDTKEVNPSATSSRTPATGARGNPGDIVARLTITTLGDEDPIRAYYTSEESAEADRLTTVWAGQTPECADCARKCAITVNRECFARSRPKDMQKRAPLCRSLTSYDYSGSCRQNCLKKYCLLPEDLAKAFKGKRVFGLIDTCYSAGIETMPHPNFRFLTSTAVTESSPDSPDGGRLTQALNKLGVLCNLREENHGFVDLRSIREKYHENLENGGDRVGLKQSASTSSAPADCAIAAQAMNCPSNTKGPRPETSR